MLLHRRLATLFVDQAFDEQMQAHDDADDLRRLDRIRAQKSVPALPLLQRGARHWSRASDVNGAADHDRAGISITALLGLGLAFLLGNVTRRAKL
jgi:hypothetical protein